jgi:dCTP deaminase
MILSDFEIERRRMIRPFVGKKTGTPSHGVSSYGYDIRLGSEFKIYSSNQPGTLDPSKPSELREGTHYFKENCTGAYRLPPGGFVLAHSMEVITMPRDIVAMVKDKSTYARLGVSLQNTVLEPGWTGQITLEISNHNTRPVLLLIGEGIAQLMFWKGKPCHTPYGNGKYQGQTGVVMPR